MTSLSGLTRRGSDEPEREFQHAERLLLRAERELRFLDRLLPDNLASERARLLVEFSSGRVSEPCFEYSAATGVERLAPFLSSISTTLAGLGPLGQLYAERADELLLEASLLAALGSAEFRVLARARYSPPADANGDETEATVAQWSQAQDSEPHTERSVRADDEHDPESLISVLRARIGALRVPVRVQLREGLPAIAAAGDGFVVLRPNTWLQPSEALRIAHHELEAHVLPRLAAKRETLGIFRVGARGAGDEEEGRALLIEQRAGLFPAARRRELSLRHRAAKMVHDGACFAEVVRGLEAEAVPVAGAVDLALRVLRGGGLGRELVYIPAYLRLKREFARDPSLEQWYERGRLSLSAARVLMSLERRAGGAVPHASFPARAQHPAAR